MMMKMEKQKKSTNKKYAKSIDFSLVYKHLCALEQHGPQLPTNQSCHAGQNYNSTIKYLNSLCEFCRWIKISNSDDGHQIIEITNEGFEVKKRLESFFEMTNVELTV